MKILSIIIPAYNEARYIGTLLPLVQAVPTEMYGFTKEIIVVDDGSSDNTFEIVAGHESVRCIRQASNQGQGRAIQRGVAACSGDFVLVQDADLEYDPADYLPMLHALKLQSCLVVYGSRTLGQRHKTTRISSRIGKHKDQLIGAWLAGLCLSTWTFMLYGKWLTDTLTAYKLYPAKLLKSFTIKTNGFETDHEITAKLLRAHIQIVEVPVSYAPRSVQEGKKIRARDGFIALWTLLRFRFSD